jgi:hypothetical protein
LEGYVLHIRKTRENTSLYINFEAFSKRMSDEVFPDSDKELMDFLSDEHSLTSIPK